MVLYYRQNQSTAQVATHSKSPKTPSASASSAADRCSATQVANMLERNLARSAPSAQFTSAVVAALPALMAQSATAAATGGAVKAHRRQRHPLASLPCHLDRPHHRRDGRNLRHRRSIRATKRRANANSWYASRSSSGSTSSPRWPSCLRSWNSDAALSLERQDQPHAQSAFWLIYCAALVVMILRWNRRHRQLRIEEGLPAVPTSVAIVTPGGRFLSLAGPAIGGVSWIFAMALPAKDIPGRRPSLRE
jgi:hypothetical protein